MEKVLLPLLLGTSRKGRRSEVAAKWVYEQMEKHPDIDTRFFDVRDFDLPNDDYSAMLKDHFPEWRDTILAADGLVIVTPEYNHGIPGSLKNVLDILLKEYIHKAVGFVGVSAGAFGGARAIETLVPMVRELGLSPTFTDLTFPRIQDLFDESGNLKDEAKYAKRIQGFLDELVWMSRALKWGRKNLSS